MKDPHVFNSILGIENTAVTKIKIFALMEFALKWMKEAIKNCYITCEKVLLWTVMQGEVIKID